MKYFPLSLRKGILFITLLLVPLVEIVAEEESRANVGTYVISSVESLWSPDKVRGYLRCGGANNWQVVRSVVLKELPMSNKPSDDVKRIQWGGVLSIECPENGDLLLIFEGKDNLRQFYVRERGEYAVSSASDIHSVRGQVEILREQLDQSRYENERQKAALQRLKRDASVIGGFEEVIKMEEELRSQEREIKRIRLQREQIEKRLAAVKSWSSPADIVERIRSLERDIQELQVRKGQ